MAGIYRSSSTNLVRAGSLARDTGFGGYVAFGGPTLSVADLGSLTRLEDKIRLLQEDLEAERELRNRIERERADLSVQLIGLTDRLEDAEGSTDAQIEANRKREIELQKNIKKRFWIIRNKSKVCIRKTAKSIANANVCNTK